MANTYNYIDSNAKANHILETIKNEDINLWTLKPYQNCFDKYYVDAIAEEWQHKQMKGEKFDTLTLVGLTMEYLMFPFLDGKIDYYTYKKVTDNYTANVLNADFDHAYNVSIKVLWEIGYN